MFILFLSTWSWQCIYVKWFFVQSREKQKMICHSVSFVQRRPLSSAYQHDNHFFFSFLLPQRHPLFDIPLFTHLRFFFSVFLRQRRKNIQNERKTDELFSLFYFSYVFFCCLWYIYLGSLLLSYTHTHAHRRSKKN